MRAVVRILISFAALNNAAAGNIKESTWYDCSSEVGIDEGSRLLTFSSVRSVPPIVTPKSGQTILKTVKYDPSSTSSSGDEAKPLQNITVDFHQYYNLFGKRWMTFLVVHGIDECKEHPNLCPLEPGEEVELRTIHPPLNPLTPCGWYRSRQVYHNADTGDKIGCVDMSFQYCKAEDACKGWPEDISWAGLRGRTSENS